MRPAALPHLLAVLALAAPATAAADTTAQQIGKLVAPVRQTTDRFGSAVAVDGAAGVVGSPLATVNAAAQSGRLHALAGADWGMVADIDSTFGATGSRLLGTSAAISGPLAIFGAPVYLSNIYYAGGVYVYAAADVNVWQLEAILPAPMPATDKLVGLSVGLADDKVLAGMQLDTMGMPGRAYAWQRTSPGVWSAPQTLAAPDLAPDDRFGVAVDVRGDRALVGAPGADADRGAAYVFEWSGTAWTAAGKLVAADRMPGDIFGAAVAIDGDTALVGAPGRNGTSGAAYVFVKEGDTWVEHGPALVPLDLEPKSRHGFEVALRVPYAVVGAIDHGLDPNLPTTGGTGRGVWYGRADDGTWLQLAAIIAEDGIPGDRLGWSIALDGGSALLGAPGDDDNLGSVYLFRLAQPDGAACVAADDCASKACCDGTCMATCAEPTSTGPDSTSTTSTASTGDLPPALDLDPAEDPGCACTSRHVPGDSRPTALALLLLAAWVRARTPRRGPRRPGA